MHTEDGTDLSREEGIVVIHVCRRLAHDGVPDSVIMEGMARAGLRDLPSDWLDKVRLLGWRHDIDYTSAMRRIYRELIEQVVEVAPDCFGEDRDGRFIWLTKEQRAQKAELARAEYERWMASLDLEI